MHGGGIASTTSSSTHFDDREEVLDWRDLRMSLENDGDTDDPREMREAKQNSELDRALKC